MKYSFVVLALSAAYASAQDQCTYQPPEAPVVIDVQPDDTTPVVVVTPKVKITDFLCFAKGKDPNEALSWFDVQAEIDSLEASITQRRNQIINVRECEENALTAWKEQYPFECPSVEPSVEDWESFLVSQEQLDLNKTAQKRRDNASALKKSADDIKKRLETINSQIESRNTEIVDNQKLLDQVNAFRDYWESAGGEYKLVKEFFDTQIKDLKEAIDIAQKAYDEAA